MKLKKNSILGRYCKFVFGSLPENICKFPSVVISLLIFPIIIPAALPFWSSSCWNNQNLFEKFCWGIFHWLLIFLLWALGINILFELLPVSKDWPMWLILLGGIGGIITSLLLVASLLTIIGFSIYFHDKVKERNARRKAYDIDRSVEQNKPEPGPSILQTWLKSIKDKTCIKINWE